MRLNPKYFLIRTAVMASTVTTPVLVYGSFWITRKYFTLKSTTGEDIFWLMILMISLTLVFGFLTYIAYKSYKETFRKGDKIMWQVSKWKVIRRWLFEPYR